MLMDVNISELTSSVDRATNAYFFDLPFSFCSPSSEAAGASDSASKFQDGLADIASGEVEPKHQLNS